MFSQLVVNGDSYMEAYAQGNGHVDLGQRLGINKCHSMAIGGSPNSRLIRTTLKHSYAAQEPTIYVLGVGFISRWEVAILNADDDSFEGRWTNPQNQDYKNLWQREWGKKETEKLIELKLNADMWSILDRFEDLMYNLLSLIDSLHARGHGILMYQQADNCYHDWLDHPKMSRLKNNSVFIDGLAWRAVQWQLNNGVPPMKYAMEIYHVPDDMRHPQSGCHDLLNTFLVNYIKNNKLI
jgi:hypothetical protein